MSTWAASPTIGSDAGELTAAHRRRLAAASITASIKGVSVVNPSKPGKDDEEERSRRQEQAGESGDAGTEAVAAGWGWCDGCDAPDCDVLPDCDCGGCDFPLLLAAAVVSGNSGQGHYFHSRPPPSIRPTIRST